jgi:hypothetical protein
VCISYLMDIFSHMKMCHCRNSIRDDVCAMGNTGTIGERTAIEDHRL